MLRFFDGFDHYNQADVTSKWSSVSAITSRPDSAATRFSGGLGFLLVTGILKKVMPDDQKIWTLGAAVRLGQIDLTNPIFQLFQGNTSIANVTVEINGKVSITCNNATGSSVLARGTKILQAGTWYFMEWRYECASVAGNVVTSLKISNVVEASFGGGDTITFPATTAGATANTISISSGTFCTNHFDDFYAIDDARRSGTINNVAGYSTGASSMLVTGLSGIVVTGNTFTLASETGTPTHTVVSHSETSGNTTSVTFSPALASNIANGAAIVFTSAHNTFLGDVRVDTLSPTGAGTTTQWTPSTGSNWAAVDETQQNGDTDYVSSATSTNLDLYALSDLTTVATTIFGVQVSAFARKDDAPSRTMDLVIRVNSVNYQSNDLTLTTSYAWYSKVLDKSPNTNIAWTTTEINASQAGVILVS